MPYRSVSKYARYLLVLLREFRRDLAVILALILGGGLQLTLSLHLPYAKSCFTVFMLMLAQPSIDFPAHWYNQVLFFAVPIIGLGAIADSVVRLGYLVFASKRKVQEWWIMEASLMRNHVVLVGLGKVGLRIAKDLRQLGERFVVIDKDKEGEFIGEMQDVDVPVIFGDARHRHVLEKANVAGARAIVLATDDDLANIDAALTAREIKADIKVVIRFFDDTLARKFTAAFQLTAISTSQVSAPAFVAAATGRNVLHAFQLDGRVLHVADLQIEKLAGRKLCDVEHEFDLSVILHKSPGRTDVNPRHERPIEKGDTVVVMAEQDRVRRLEEANRG